VQGRSRTYRAITEEVGEVDRHHLQVAKCLADLSNDSAFYVKQVGVRAVEGQVG